MHDGRGTMRTSRDLQRPVPSTHVRPIPRTSRDTAPSPAARVRGLHARLRPSRRGLFKWLGTASRSKLGCAFTHAPAIATCVCVYILPRWRICISVKKYRVASLAVGSARCTSPLLPAGTYALALHSPRSDRHTTDLMVKAHVIHGFINQRLALHVN
jgi:hypothetical protein